jgi:hypothetical protein
MTKEIELLELLRKRLNEFKLSDLYISNISFRQDARFIEIMINLSELAFENNRKIKIEERNWFEGAYLLDNSFTGKWSDISNLYAKIVDSLNEMGKLA